MTNRRSASRVVPLSAIASSLLLRSATASRTIGRLVVRQRELPRGEQQALSSLRLDDRQARFGRDQRRPAQPAAEMLHDRTQGTVPTAAHARAVSRNRSSPTPRPLRSSSRRRARARAAATRHRRSRVLTRARASTRARRSRRTPHRLRLLKRRVREDPRRATAPPIPRASNTHRAALVAIGRLRSEAHRGVPEATQERHLARVVPHRRGHGAARSRHPSPPSRASEIGACSSSERRRAGSRPRSHLPTCPSAGVTATSCGSCCRGPWLVRDGEAWNVLRHEGHRQPESEQQDSLETSSRWLALLRGTRG